MTPSSSQPRIARVLTAVGTTALVVVLAIHLLALGAERAARDPQAAPEMRVAAAKRAVRLEPFNPRFEVTLAIALAEQDLAAGRVDEAYFTLLPLSTTVRGDEQFRDTYRRAVALKWTVDARKAHQQHAREKAGGALDPEDVER